MGCEHKYASHQPKERIGPFHLSRSLWYGRPMLATNSQRFPVWLTREAADTLDRILQTGVMPRYPWGGPGIVRQIQGALNDAILEADNQVKRVKLGCSRHPDQALTCPRCAGARRRPSASLGSVRASA